GDPHSHPHVQASYVAEGAFEVPIDGKTETVAAGGAFIVPSGLVHSAKALEKGRLIDTFTPARQDFPGEPLLFPGLHVERKTACRSRGTNVGNPSRGPVAQLVRADRS